MAKTYNNSQKYQFFNDVNYDNLETLLLKELNTIADKYSVEHINLKKIDYNYPSDFNARTWSWRSGFFIEYLNKVNKIYNNDDQHFCRVWLDALIRQCGYMIWNLVYKTTINEWKKTGKIPNNTLSRKLRNNIEAVASHFADIETEKFEKKFQ